MKSISSLIILFIFLCLSCQDVQENITYPEFYRSFNKVLDLVGDKQMDKAVIKFDKLTARIAHVPSYNYMRMAHECAQEGRCKLAATYLEKSLHNGQEYGKGIGRYKTIDLCANEINPVLVKEKQIHDQYFNAKYKALIDSMYQADQAARIAENREEAMKVDSLNMITLLEQINLNGYPGEKKIGDASAFNAFIMILHMDRDKNNKLFKPILDEAFSNGQIWPRGYAWIVDRRRAWGDDELEPYYYHMQSKRTGSFNEEKLLEINRRRDSIGLEPK